jgi:hypothetical protein
MRCTHCLAPSAREANRACFYLEDNAELAPAILGLGTGGLIARLPLSENKRSLDKQ